MLQWNHEAPSIDSIHDEMALNGHRFAARVGISSCRREYSSPPCGSFLLPLPGHGDKPLGVDHGLPEGLEEEGFDLGSLGMMFGPIDVECNEGGLLYISTTILGCSFLMLGCKGYKPMWLIGFKKSGWISRVGMIEICSTIAFFCWSILQDGSNVCGTLQILSGHGYQKKKNENSNWF